MESLTDSIEDKARELLERIADMGGAVSAIEQGFPQGEIEDAAYRYATSVERNDEIVVGVNDFTVDDGPRTPIMSVDPALEAQQRKRLVDLRTRRDAAAVERALGAVAVAAAGDGNLLYPMKDALAALATVGEVSGVLEGVFGRY